MSKKITVSIAIAMALAMSLVAFAQEPWIIPQGQAVDRDAFLAGDLVQNYGTVNGDLFMAGNNLNTLGNVAGDILMAGNTCNVSGNVEGDIRAAGNVLAIDASVKKNASLVGNTITIGSGGIEGSVSVYGATVTINGNIGRDLRSGAGSIALNGNIGRNVDIESRSITFGPNAKIGGNLTYTAESEIQIPEGVVAGTVIFKKAQEPIKHTRAEDAKKNIRAFSMVGKLLGLLSYLVVGSLAVYLFKEPFTTASDTIAQKPWASLGIGFVGLVIIPVALIVVMITVIGIPLAMIVWALYFIALYIARLPVALWLGRKILKSDTRTILQMLLGLLILGILAMIPHIGGWISFVVLLFGLGSMMIWINSHMKKQKPKIEIETENTSV